MKIAKGNMQVGPSIQVEAFRCPLIKPTLDSRLGSMVSVFPCPWISDVSFGPGGRPNGTKVAGRPGPGASQPSVAPTCSLTVACYPLRRFWSGKLGLSLHVGPSIHGMCLSTIGCTTLMESSWDGLDMCFSACR